MPDATRQSLGGSGTDAGVPTPSGSGRLSFSDANPLAAAMVCRLATTLGLRALIIKGLSLEYHGLRPGHLSADIDVFVDPAHIEDLIAAVMANGWTLRPTSAGDRLMTHHSVTLLNADWPNDIDVHSTFPGLLAGPQPSFEVLWTHRTSTTLAGFPCWIPDRPSAMVIWALHSLRGSAQEPRHARELGQLVSGVLPTLSTSELHELADRIVQLGADRPLKAVPEFADLLGDRHGLVDAAEWNTWQSKFAQAHEVSPWLQVLRETPPVHVPGRIARAVWPSRHDLLVIDPATVNTPVGRLQARVRRIGRLIHRVRQRAAEFTSARTHRDT